MTTQTNPAAASEPVRVKITIPTNVYFLSGIRNFTLEMARNVAGFDEQWAFRFQTVVDELTNNAIEHGSREGDEIDLAFEVEKEKSILITVVDRGHGKSKFTAAEMTVKAAEAKARAGKPTLDLRGRGFQIIGNWSDEISFADNEFGGLSVRVKKAYKPTEEKLSSLQSIPTEGNVFVLDV